MCLWHARSIHNRPGICLWHARSIRNRPGSLRMKSTSTAFQLLRENGDLKTSSTLPGATTDVHKMDEFDIKMLQQKRHEAEVKRCVFHNDTLTEETWGRGQEVCVSQWYCDRRDMRPRSRGICFTMILWRKRHEAEVKRYVFHNDTLTEETWGRGQEVCVSQWYCDRRDMRPRSRGICFTMILWQKRHEAKVKRYCVSQWYFDGRDMRPRSRGMCITMILWQKRPEAEVKRYVFHNDTVTDETRGRGEEVSVSQCWWHMTKNHTILLLMPGLDSWWAIVCS